MLADLFLNCTLLWHNTYEKIVIYIHTSIAFMTDVALSLGSAFVDHTAMHACLCLCYLGFGVQVRESFEAKVEFCIILS